VPEAIAIFGAPTRVSLKKKLPVPPEIGTEVMVPSKGPVPKVSKKRVAESDERFAVPEKLDTRLLN
ncbi:MAG: hypothetical protein GWN33_03930, partial [Gammaproteobacteria bacterium]|nr:hypothetical protein [Gammaproteobacteria bacterium]